jgi:hypothetical protein
LTEFYAISSVELVSAVAKLSCFWLSQLFLWQWQDRKFDACNKIEGFELTYWISVQTVGGFIQEETLG